MNVELIDDSGEIRCTAFNQDADRLGSIFEVGKVCDPSVGSGGSGGLITRSHFLQVYTVRGGRLKLANKKFNRTNNQYEITFGGDTEVFVSGVLKILSALT